MLVMLIVPRPDSLVFMQLPGESSGLELEDGGDFLVLTSRPSTPSCKRECLRLMLLLVLPA